MKLIPKKTFLLRQDEIEGGKKKDVIAKKGVAIEVTEKEAVRFFGHFMLTDAEKKRVVSAARVNPQLKRLV